MIRKLAPSAKDAALGELVVQYLAQKKTERGNSYNFIASLDRSLQMTFEKRVLDFEVPENFVIRPVRPGEFRTFVEERGWAICQAGTAHIELPDDISKIPLLVLDNDKSSVNMAALHFMMERCHLMLLYHPDADHMDWNCVKGSLTNCSWFPWKVVS